MHEKYAFYFPPLPPRNILKVPFEGFIDYWPPGFEGQFFLFHVLIIINRWKATLLLPCAPK
jgi:hypothetical protein